MTRERLNIRLDSPDPRAQKLSNLYLSPFRMGGYEFLCVEAALQGIKIKDDSERLNVFGMGGIEALRAGRKITRAVGQGDATYVYWDANIYPYNSIEHRMLIATFIHEKIRQNRDIQEALLATSGTFIYHDVGMEHPGTSLPEKIYIQILLNERRLLQRLNDLA